MSWVKEAENAERIQAEHDERFSRVIEAERAKFDADPEKYVTKFLKDWETPVSYIVRDLVKAGYTASKTGPQYLYDEPLESKDDPLEGEFSLSRVVFDQSTSKYHREVFGLDWELSKADSKLGSIRIYLTPGIVQLAERGEYHFRSETYGNYEFRLVRPEFGQAYDMLKGGVSDWIKKANATN